HRFSTHPHWVTVTTIAVLQPYPGPTSTRAAERVVGTVLGSAVAAAITMTVHAPLALAAVMFPLSVAAVATKPRSYRLFTFFLTPVFVLIAEQHPGDWWTAAARAGDSVLGGAIALVAALLVWPTWEHTRLPDALEAMVAAVSRYRAVVLDGLATRTEGETATAVATARRAAGIALGEAETSLERWLAEPLRKPADGEHAMQLVTHARRLANACTALDTRAVHGLADDASREIHRSAIDAYAEAIQRRASRPPPVA
ncbi:MAG TPA: FUSC family protein, partial [Labilithrix sp.]|nr:FUSC family protein [Labilithrix sp.]